MQTEDLRGEFGESADIVLSNVGIIANGYTDAALALDIDLDAVERAVLGAAKQYGGCVSCRYSRAGRDADQYAAKRGRLPVTIRTCALGLRQETYSARESVFPE